MKCVSIPDARRLANDHGMTRLLVLGIDDDGHFAFTTFGRTRAQCAAMAEWADAHAPHVAAGMDQSTKPLFGGPLA